MAFNIQIFRTRAITAIVFAIVMMGGLLWNGSSFVVLFTIIHFGCWYEFFQIVKRISPSNYLYKLPLGLFYITLPTLLLFSLGFPETFFYLQRNEIATTLDFAKVFAWPLEYNRLIPCFIIFSIWINDTMAYIVGSFIGRTPFSKISPKKTWEGTIGGAIMCVLVITLVSRWKHFIPIKDAIWLSSICAFFGTLGDLLESKLKRMARIKDSGSLMPGHGGFLDRFDSFLIATTFVWLYLYLINH